MARMGRRKIPRRSALKPPALSSPAWLPDRFRPLLFRKSHPRRDGPEGPPRYAGSTSTPPEIPRAWCGQR